MDAQAEPSSRARCYFLELPRELRDQIYSYIIPTKRLFIFLLLDDKGRYFTFDRGYAFPVFQASFLSACSIIHLEGKELWLREGHFRLEIGEDLGKRSGSWMLFNSIIRRMRRCDIRVVMPFYSYGLYEHLGRLRRLLIRRLMNRFLETFVQGKSLRQMEFVIRDSHKSGQVSAGGDSDWEGVYDETHEMACNLWKELLRAITTETRPFNSYLESKSENTDTSGLENVSPKTDAKNLNITYQICDVVVPIDDYTAKYPLPRGRP